MILQRTSKSKYGIFGKLIRSGDNVQICVTLEHAYLSNGEYTPKLPPGDYVCVRGQHQLEGMDGPFTTFEVTGVTGHSGILLHVGNYNSDSDGCILLGKKNTISSITKSRETFESFMNMMEGQDSFVLTVKEIAT